MHRFFSIVLVLLLCSAAPAHAAAGTVWESSLSPERAPHDYRAPVARLLQAYEAAGGQPLVPGEFRRVALKVYCASGPGLMTPHGLTRAVLDELEQRGFRREEMLIVGQDTRQMRECGYLPWPWKADPSYEGAAVLALNNGEHYDAAWFYESNLPSLAERQRAQSLPDFSFEVAEDTRRSYLPTPLFLKTDFWINLPMGSDSDALGVSGALANASLWAVSNHERFRQSPASGPVAVAEIAAVPELRSRWRLSLLTLESYQFMGQWVFNAHYTRHQPRLWLSTDPVALDALLWQEIRQAKRAEWFKVPFDEPLPVLRYASSVGLGSFLEPQVISVDEGVPVRAK